MLVLADKSKNEPKVHFVEQVIKGDTYLVMAASQIELEDEFSSLYFTTQNQSNIFLMPPFDPIVLKNLVNTNNTLNQCVEVMEVNIDATGIEFVASDATADAIKEKKKNDAFKKAKDKHAQVMQQFKQKTAPPIPDPMGSNIYVQPHVDPIPPDPPEPPAGDGIDPKEKQIAQSFFDEPYPGTSFIQIRRQLRRELEGVGYGFLEVLRNPLGDVVAMRPIQTHNVRLVKLDAPVMVQKTVQRAGVDVQLSLWLRERRYAQRVALKQLVYYREYGATRNIDRNNGQWEVLPGDDNADGKPVNIVAPGDRGTELLMFGIHPDITTPYFLPRWINQMPSVVGSRKAEEQNLEFFDAGGMPPAIIFVQGGTLAKDAADQLRNYLSGKNKTKFRAVVVEAQSSSGSLEAAGTVQVKVERFGAEKAMDAMYKNYDETAGEHVRMGFRIPPLFLGKAADYNFATAVTAYMVAEEQVFQPERTKFDEIINTTIIKALGLKTLQIKSLPITLTDAANQLKALEIVKDRATPDSYVDEINKATGMDLEVSVLPQPDRVSEADIPDPITGQPTPQAPKPGQVIPGGGSSPPAAPGTNNVATGGIIPQAGQNPQAQATLQPGAPGGPGQTPGQDPSQPPAQPSQVGVPAPGQRPKPGARPVAGTPVVDPDPDKRDAQAKEQAKSVQSVAQNQSDQNSPAKKPGNGGATIEIQHGDGTKTKIKVKKATELMDMAMDFAVSRGLLKGRPLSPERALILKQDIDELTPDDFEAFNSLVATYTYGKADESLISIAKAALKHDH